MKVTRWGSRTHALLRVQLRRAGRYLRPRLLFALWMARAHARRLRRSWSPRLRELADRCDPWPLLSRLDNGHGRRLVGTMAALLGVCLGLVVFGGSSRGPKMTAAESGPIEEVIPVSYTRTASIDPEDGSNFRSAQAIIAESGTATDGYDAMVRVLKIIRAGSERFERVPDYTATFLKQERVDGVLGDREGIELKLRHQPYSIYMNWTEGSSVGREILFADGKNDNEMLYHSGGWKGRLLPAIKLNPHGRTALSHSRYPVTDLGLVATARRTLIRRQKNVDDPTGYRFHIDEHADFEGRDCILCTLHFENENNDEKYRKSHFWVDREHLVPIAIRNYGWPGAEIAGLEGESLDAETLLEDYAYVNVRLRQQLADQDFDASNSDYRFRR